MESIQPKSNLIQLGLYLLKSSLTQGLSGIWRLSFCCWKGQKDKVGRIPSGAVNILRKTTAPFLSAMFSAALYGGKGPRLNTCGVRWQCSAASILAATFGHGRPIVTRRGAWLHYGRCQGSGNQGIGQTSWRMRWFRLREALHVSTMGASTQLPVWSYILNTAVVSYTPSRPQNHIGI